MTVKDFYILLQQCQRVAKAFALRVFYGTTENDEFLVDWCKKNRYSTKLTHNLTNGEWLQGELSRFHRSEKTSAQLRLQHAIQQKKSRIAIVRRVAAVAALFVLFIGTYFLYNRSEETNSSLIVPMNPEVKVPSLIVDMKTIPVTDKAISGKDSVVDVQQLAQSNGESLNAQVLPIETIVQQRFVVPLNQHSKIQLCDGTLVYLNSGSELRFPSRFADTCRDVELIGEGFFEVSKSSRPFVVHIGDVSVKVYGTKFNVNAYTPHIVETVLVEGSVGVKLGSQELRLKEKEKCTTNAQRATNQVEPVNVEKYIAWVDRRLVYEKDNLQKLLSELSQWYGVNFYLKDKDLPDFRFTTIIYEDTPLDEVLSMLAELDLPIEFTKQKGGEYIVRKKSL